MSKAFLRESDSEDTPELPPTVALLPPGTRNCVTPTGALRMRNELSRLVDQERPALAAAAQDPNTKRELLALDQRIRHLSESLRTAEIVPPPEKPNGVVRFGATVSIREPDGSRSSYRLVGVDEADPENGSVNWMSPLGRALLNARVGQRVTFRAPAATRELEILAVDYDPPLPG